MLHVDTIDVVLLVLFVAVLAFGSGALFGIHWYTEQFTVDLVTAAVRGALGWPVP